MIQTRQSLSVFYCGIFHLWNTFECTCVGYNLVLFAVFVSLIFWLSHLTNQNNATTFCIIRKYLLFRKTFKLTPPKCAHWSTYQLMSQCCPLLLHYPPHWYSYFRLCPSTWMNLGLLWIACYEMWLFCSLLNAIHWYKLNL